VLRESAAAASQAVTMAGEAEFAAFKSTRDKVDRLLYACQMA
jgi:hypothetical protein